MASHIDHSSLVKALCKHGVDVKNDMTPLTAHLLHMAVGISGEAGELLDSVKKSTIYCKPLDIQNVIEELGDLEFYLEGLRIGLGITREQVLEHNINKLSERYSKGSYSNEQAIQRADKEPS